MTTASLTVRVEFDVPARMRDSTILRANVYRPEGDGPWPTLLTRTPYGKDWTWQTVWDALDPVEVARRGFLVVVQDVRGRNASEGEWVPCAAEREDGYDSVEWAARLPGSNGRVGMFSGSYGGSTQWLAAIERPPSLKAIVPTFTWSEPTDGLTARGGAVELGISLQWALLNHGETIARRTPDAAEAARRIDAYLDERDRAEQDGYLALPVSEGRPLRRHDIPDLGQIASIHDPTVAARSRVAGRHDRVEAAVLNLGGWYDYFTQATLDHHVAMVAAGRPSWLVVGPWTHTGFADPIGQRHFGIRANRDGIPVTLGGIDWSTLQRDWLHRHLVPGSEAELPPAPVRIFTMGRNAWRDEPAWPLERAVEQRWHLQADGSLSPREPKRDAPASTFVYDPADPVPAVGGNGPRTIMHGEGPYDQAAVEAREDVLVFTSEPLTEELEVTGRVRVVLHAESSAPSTDWVARLCDVDPEGRSFPVCDGIVRVFEGADGCARHEIDLWSTSNAFLPGHRIRVHVTSSSFPRWDRNLNTGDQDDSRHQPARQRVHHDPERPSYVVLPVVDAPLPR
jgi:putative CocE/NonD family hydrolase